MRGSTRTGRAARAATLAAAAALALGGCAVLEEAGTAVTVAGDRVSTERLQDLTQELVGSGWAVDPQTQQPLAPGDAQRTVLGVVVTSRVLERLAAEEGVSVSDGQVDARWAEYVEATGGEEALRQGLASQRGVPPSYARDYVRDLLLAEEVQRALVPGDDADPAVQQERAQALSERLVQVGQEADVEVNPRYGTWSPTTGQVAPLVSAGLAVPEGGAPGQAPAAPAPQDPGGEQPAPEQP
ncbi:hypothetical protein [Vallicoccus soli]|uniref:SurA N-terminal domain-containing protein n=1 Tax=Vallicoccus soli TaxID=2339232 RepID=A0A3A3Z3E3_9ACTN|nr:hypothetical protein [Vallicoccus soli]RJK97922.1 hypothetical protein D5H78_02855 [Vallicoccus soli]